MSTTISVEFNREGLSTVETAELFESAFGEFDRIVKRYTRFDENSELSNLNRQSGKPVKVSEEFFELISYMLELAQQSNGAYDPTVIDFLEMYGYDKDRDFSKLEKESLPEDIKKRLSERPAWTEIQMEKENLTVTLAKSQKIDLGGVGKGFAIDKASEHLIEKVTDYMVAAGGDMRVGGTNEEGEKWRISLKGMKDGKEEVIGDVELENEAIASSGSWARKVGSFHHLIDPKSGKPTERDYSTVFVQASTAMKADGWATALFVDKNLKNPNINYFIF